MKRGRPKLADGKAKDSTVVIRVTDAERAAIEAQAAKSDKPLTDWIRGKIFEPAPAAPRKRSAIYWGDIKLEIDRELTQDEWRRLRDYVTVVLKPDEGEVV